jgi:hypothetical protein
VKNHGGKRRGNVFENLRSMERKIQNRLIIACSAPNKKAAVSPRRPVRAERNYLTSALDRGMNLAPVDVEHARGRRLQHDRRRETATPVNIAKAQFSGKLPAT